MLHRLGCAGCSLDRTPCNTPKMPPTLAKGASVYILAEAPELEDDEVSGRPLTGPSGKLLRECLPEGPVATFDNVINCLTPDNRAPSWQEAESCRPRREKFIEQARPKLILGLGVVPLKFMLGSTDLDGMRGRLFAVQVGSHTCWFLPTYHPSKVREKAYDQKKPLNGKFGHCFRMDIGRAYSLVSHLRPPIIESAVQLKHGIRIFSGGDLDGLRALLDLARLAPIKAIDIETKGLRPYRDGADIMSIAISFDSTDFAFAWDHPQAKWTAEQKYQIAVLLEQILKDDTIKVAHNAPFELEWFISYFGLKVVNHTAWGDTQVQAQFLDERRGKAHGPDDHHRAAYQSLDFLCRQHFGLSHKPLFKLDKRDMSKTDLGECLTYNAVDTRQTLRLYHRQTELLKQVGTHDAYLEALPRQASVAIMQTLGVTVDQTEVKRIQVMLGGEVDGLIAKINDLKVVKQYIQDKGQFNPASGPDTLAIFGANYLKCPEIHVGDRVSVDKNVLDQIDHPLAALIAELRTRSKLKATYCDSLELGKGNDVWQDGKIHTNFNTTFAETGRTSCVPYWTRILTSKGYQAIRDVKEGDLVWTHKGRWRRVISTWVKGHELMYDLYLSNGQVLTCTKNHRLLQSSGGWATIGEIHNVFKEVGFRSQECGFSPGGVPQQGYKISKANSSGAGYHRKQCVVGYEEPLRPIRACSPEDAALLSIKAGQQEPHEGQSFRETSQLEGRVQRWLRLSDNKDQGRTDFCSSRSNSENLWPKDTANRVGNSSHRWKPQEQPHRQPSSCNKSWTYDHSFPGAPRFQIVEIEEIKTSGRYEVFDITVDEDASYAACGVFSHNSDGPNLQNYPQRKDAWVRKQVVAEPGHVLVAFDYGQLEACTAAMCSLDKVLVKALWEDYDIHMEWSEKLAAAYPQIDHSDMKKLRSRVKNKLVFPAIFGAQDSSIAGYLGIPEEVVAKLMREFWATFHGLKHWQDRLMKSYYEVGWVASPTGRRHHYPLTRNQAINHPVQSLACDIVCSAMNELSYQAVSTGNWYLHPRLNIHDDLTFSIPDNDATLEAAITQIYHVMLTPPYPCVNVPLSVKASIGKNWFEMTEFGTFWSHKDL